MGTPQTTNTKPRLLWGELSRWAKSTDLRSTETRDVSVGEVQRERPTVLFISPQPFFVARGSPIRVRAEAEALAELGFQVDLLVFPFGRDVQIPGVRLVRIPNPLGLNGIPVGPSFWKGVYDLLLFWKALRLALSKRYVAVHCVEEAGVIGLVVRRMIACKLVFDKHSDVESYRGRSAPQSGDVALPEGRQVGDSAS